MHCESGKKAIRYSLTPSLFRACCLFAAAAIFIPLLACGSSMKDAQTFKPNKAPVVESYTVVNQATSEEITSSTDMIIGTMVVCTVKANDPEGMDLSYSFGSDFGTTTKPVKSADGCKVTFLITRVIGLEPVILQLSVSDPKKATVVADITVGKGLPGATLTVDSPYIAASAHPEYIQPTGKTEFTFSATANGIFKLLESNTDSAPAWNSKPVSVDYTASTTDTPSRQTITVVGSDYVGDIDYNTVKVSAGDGEKKIWILFKDENNNYKPGYTVVHQDGSAPALKSSVPADGATSVSISPTVTLVFSEDIDQTTLSSALALSPADGTVTLQSYDVSKFSADYSVAGLKKNTTYTASVSGAKNLTGIQNKPASFTFTTTPTYLLTYDGSGAAISIAASSYAANETVQVTSEIPVRTGNTFSCWSDAGGTNYASGTSFQMPAHDVTLYAVWTKLYYTVTYVCTDKTNGTVPAVSSYAYGDTVTVSSYSAAAGYLSKIVPSTAGYYCTWNDGSVLHAEDSTFAMPAANVTLSAVWNNYFAPYDDGYGGKVICKGPTGGYIVYDAGNYSSGWRYMEIPPTDQSAGCKWWKDETVYVTGTVSTLGKGLENTTAIVTRLGTSESYAAQICSGYSLCGYNGWFLPSLDELTTIRGAIKSTYVNPVCSFAAVNYWTSTEVSADSAYCIRFQATGASAYTLKDTPYADPIRVRAVRRF
jgi:hypothetical protein